MIISKLPYGTTSGGSEWPTGEVHTDIFTTVTKTKDGINYTVITGINNNKYTGPIVIPSILNGNSVCLSPRTFTQDNCTLQPYNGTIICNTNLFYGTPYGGYNTLEIPFSCIDFYITGRLNYVGGDHSEIFYGIAFMTSYSSVNTAPYIHIKTGKYIHIGPLYNESHKYKIINNDNFKVTPPTENYELRKSSFQYSNLSGSNVINYISNANSLGERCINDAKVYVDGDLHFKCVTANSEACLAGLKVINTSSDVVNVYFDNLTTLGGTYTFRPDKLTGQTLNHIYLANQVVTKTTTSDDASAIDNIYVPDDLVDAYKVASGWSNYASKIKGISEM